VVQSWVDAELVVGASVAEMETGGYGEVGLERDGELVEEPLSGGRGVGNEDTSLGRIVNAVGGIDELAHLEQGSPHGALSASNGSPPLAVVEELVHDHCTAKTQKTELHSANIQQARVGFVDDVKVVDLVLSGAQLLQDLDILTGSPHRVHGDVEGVGIVQEEGQFGER
jgi:hypothetical protein